MVKVETTHIKPLTGPNYPRWKLEVSTALEAVDLWKHCNGTSSEPVPTETDSQTE